DIVAVELAALAIGEGRRHRMAVRIEDPTGQRGARHGLAGRFPLAGIAVELALHDVEELRVKDGGVQARMVGLAVPDLAGVEAVAQQVEEGAPAEGLTAGHASGAADMRLRDYAIHLQPLFQRVDRAELEVERKDA